MDPVQTILSTILMCVVGLAAALVARRTTSTAWKWIAFGGLLWAGAMVPKVILGYFVHGPVMEFLAEHFTGPVYLLLVGAFGGLLSSSTELGLTLIAAFALREIGKRPRQALGIGAGAGALEAIVLGLLFLLMAFLCHIGGFPEPELYCESDPGGLEMTPMAWLIGPVERVMAILLHTVTRALIFIGVATGRYRLVIFSFVLFVLNDGIAEAWHASGLLETTNFWLVELSFFPITIACVFLFKWLAIGQRKVENR